MLAAILHMEDFAVRTWPGFVLWGFDRSLRLLRVIYLNFWSTPSSQQVDTIQLLSSDTVRLTVRRSHNAVVAWRPGQHFFIVLPSVSRLPWEAHPFTPASISKSDKDGVELEFVIRGRDGFTRRLLNTAKERVNGEGAKALSVLVDGPYGVPPRLAAFDTVVLIAGEFKMFSFRAGPGKT